MTEPLVLRVPGPGVWASIVEQARAHGGVLFGHRGGRPLQPFEEVPIRFVGPAGDLCLVVGRVVRLTADQVAFTFEADAVASIAAAWRNEPELAEAEPAEAEPAEAEPGEEGADAPRPYEALSKPDRIKLARQGNADERRRVLRDRDRSLHPHVLSNPGIGPAELASLVRGGSIGVEFLIELSRREDLMRHAEVVEALVRSPRTPIQLAAALVARIPEESARQIARSGNLREAVVAAARRRVIGGR